MAGLRERTLGSELEHDRFADALRVVACGRTDAGIVRHSNEDAFGIAHVGATSLVGDRVDGSTAGGGMLLEVSDGMGGALAGEVASALTIDGLVREVGVASVAANGRGVDADALRRAVERVSATVFEASKHPSRRGMGATLTAAILCGRSALVAQVGDSRAYVLRGEKIGRVTRDQSYVQMLVDIGVMTEAQASRSPRRNIVLQAIGQPTVHADIVRVAVRPGDRLLLCSDGLTNVLDDETIGRISRAPVELPEACANLVEWTRRLGAPDNVTVVLAELS